VPGCAVGGRTVLLSSRPRGGRLGSGFMHNRYLTRRIGSRDPNLAERRILDFGLHDPLSPGVMALFLQGDCIRVNSR
jgi:hypothetical protein